MSNLIYLYLKKHTKTGIQYLGKTTKDPFKYSGLQETKDKRVKTRAGYKHSDETKEKISAAAKKRKYSPEARAKFKASYWKRRLDVSDASG